MVQTKAHGGEIKVETNEGEFAKFIIQLPLNERSGVLLSLSAMG
jgi:signal transduction histidine kinase